MTDLNVQGPAQLRYGLCGAGATAGLLRTLINTPVCGCAVLQDATGVKSHARAQAVGPLPRYVQVPCQHACGNIDNIEHGCLKNQGWFARGKAGRGPTKLLLGSDHDKVQRTVPLRSELRTRDAVTICYRDNRSAALWLVSEVLLLRVVRAPRPVLSCIEMCKPQRSRERCQPMHERCD